MLHWLPVVVSGALLAGSMVFCALAILACASYRRQRVPQLVKAEPISILKPMAGLDDGLADNLRSFFRQNYPQFEVLFAIEGYRAEVLAVIEQVRAEFPNVPSRVIITEEPPYANPKTYKLGRLVPEARHGLLVMADSDIRVTPDMLRHVATEFQDPQIGMATCPYLAVAGRSFWSRLEAVMMNTEFMAGVLTARMLEGVKFALGPTIVARKQVLADIGGLDSLGHYCAEDFVMGNLAAEKGHGVILSTYIIDHRIGSSTLASALRQRMRWCRSTRRSRPAGYVGQLFINPTPLLLLFLIFYPSWLVFVACAAVRVGAAWTTDRWVLKDQLLLRQPWLLPLSDLVNFVFWLAGFFGNTVYWRGDYYYLLRDGTYRPIRP